MKTAGRTISNKKTTSARWRYDLVSYAASNGKRCRYDREVMRSALLKAVVEREGPLRAAMSVQPPKGTSREEIELAINEAIELATKPLQGRYASEIETEEVQWLWRGRIAARKLTVIDGDPGTGKSTLTIDIAARVSAGAPFPDGEVCGLGKAILVTAEDGPADTIKPRLEAAGADLKSSRCFESFPGWKRWGGRAAERPAEPGRNCTQSESDANRSRSIQRFSWRRCRWLQRSRDPNNNDFACSDG